MTRPETGPAEPETEGLATEPAAPGLNDVETDETEELTERHRLSDAAQVVHGPGGSGGLAQMLYALYVTVLLGGAYGFTTARALFVTNNPQWVREHLLTPVAAVAGLAALGIALWLSWHTGRHRGPVVPPLSWTELVVSSSLDRSLTLREFWRYSLLGIGSGVAIVGAVLGGALWASDAAGPAGLVGGIVAGLVTGIGCVYAALLGQARSRRMRAPSSTLRRMTLEGLRQQAATSDGLGGAVLAGDLRAARLEVAAPPRRGRAWRLRPGPAIVTVARRDLLGLRRAPGSLWLGLLVTALGCAGLAWCVVEPEVPAFIGVLAMLATYLGVSAWSEGLRLHADNFGTPTLLGLPPLHEALAHTIVPAVLLAVTWCGIGGAVVVLAAGDTAIQLVIVAELLPVILVAVTGVTWLAAFRGPPSDHVFSPSSGPWLLVLRAALPGIVVLLLGAAAVAVGRSGGPWTIAVGSLAILWSWAVSRHRRASSAHRG